ncbi:MAG TPA: HDOD domain-containing protein [Acidobacteriaceae bacterium]|jgi:EAL and modified HD-GYP domain-containing signal transduction protein|nr:HDOD domain-containing protein [Acidobacteriaceae bacterium]
MSAMTPSPQTRPDGSPHDSLSTPCRFLSRQPIVDAQCRLFGYELFLRPGEAEDCDPEVATREAVDHWLLLAPEPNQGSAFIRCTRSALSEGLVTVLPAESTVLVPDAGAGADPDFLKICLTLRQQGYRFALDSCVARAGLAPLARVADFIRIDFQTTDFDDRRATYAMAAGSAVQLIATNIETEIQMRIARSEGCSLFQGYFFSQPVLVSSRPVPQNHLVYLRLLGALHETPTDLRKVEKLISGDASLCYRVLRLANSAMQGHASPVTTVREALLMVGEDAVRKMATVAVAGALAGDRSSTLVSMALSRAHFCELLAPSLGELPARMYLLGMISMLDVLFETPLARILQTLPISAEMKAALGGDDSGPGRALLLVRSLESCDWQRCQETQRLLGLEEGFIASTYVEAMRSASATMREMFFPG